MARNTVVTEYPVFALCRAGWSPSVWHHLAPSVWEGDSWLGRQAVCLSVLSLSLSQSVRESTVMPFCYLWGTSHRAKLFLGAVHAVGLWIQMRTRNWKIAFSFYVAIFCCVFIGVSGNVPKFLCKFSYNSCPSRSQLNGFIVGYWTANWSTGLLPCTGAPAFLP